MEERARTPRRDQDGPHHDGPDDDVRGTGGEIEEGQRRQEIVDSDVREELCAARSPPRPPRWPRRRAGARRHGRGAPRASHVHSPRKEHGRRRDEVPLGHIADERGGEDGDLEDEPDDIRDGGRDERAHGRVALSLDDARTASTAVASSGIAHDTSTMPPVPHTSSLTTAPARAVSAPTASYAPSRPFQETPRPAATQATSSGGCDAAAVASATTERRSARPSRANDASSSERHPERRQQDERLQADGCRQTSRPRASRRAGRSVGCSTARARARSATATNG